MSMERFSIEVNPLFPFDFCGDCPFYDIKTEIIYENDKPIIFADCKHAEICTHAVKKAKEAEYES